MPTNDVLDRLLQLNSEVLTEFKFHPTRKWRLDFAIPSYKIAIEVEGGVWTRGRHITPTGFIKDIEKYNALTLQGWYLLRYTPSMLKDDTILEDVRNLMRLIDGKVSD